MKVLPKKYYIALAIVWIATIVVGGGGYYFVLKSQSNTIAKTKAQLVDAEKQYEQAQLAKNDKYKAKLEEQLLASKDRICEFIADPAETAGITFEINQIASDLNVEDFSSKRNETQSCKELPECESLGELYIDIKFDSQFNQFAKFVNLLERHTPFIFVESFEVIRSKLTDKNHKVKMSLAYFVENKLAQNSL